MSLDRASSRIGDGALDWFLASMSGRIGAVRAEPVTEEIMHFEMYRDGSGEWRWRLFASNGRQIANGGEGYVKKSDCENGIRLVKSATEDTPVRVKE